MAMVSILCMSLSEIWGNVHLKLFSQTNKHHHLAAGLLGYMGVIFFLIRSFESANMLYVSAMWEGMITVLGSIVAYVVLGERFDSAIQYWGLVLGLVAMLMVHAGGKRAH